MATIFLISCVSKKQATTAPAAEFYVSDWFKKAKAFAEGHADAWYILSAKYGLVDPNDALEPYEQTLNTMYKKERLHWSKQALNSIVNKTTSGDHIVFLAGIRYREFLAEELSRLGYTIEVPLAHMGIGEQLRWLKAKE